MKYFLFFLLFINFQAVDVFAGDTLVFVKSIAVKSKLFTSDPVGNLYVVKDNNTLIKYNSNGDSIGLFNEIKKGKITQIDATNPLRVLLFFADFGNILILDNVLSLKSTLKLTNLGLINVPCIANSADGTIWAFDPSGMLVKINDRPEIQLTISLRNVLKEAIDPIYMVEQDRTLYLVDSAEGVKRFDQFGLYRTHFPFLTKEIQYFNNYLVYYQSPYLISYHTLTFQENKIAVPLPDDIIKIRVERNIVFILRKESLDIYSLEAKP